MNGVIKKPKKKTCQITERDYKLLRFLWKWKAVSTMGLAKKFFPNINPHSAYRRLQFLETDGYIKTHPVKELRNGVWTLSEKGFKHIREKLGDLESQGYKSQSHEHDAISTAFHLGEWLTQQPHNTQTYSEQQLRCYHQDLWPEWVPRTDIHRPDGYSVYIQNNQKVIIAFETELWMKAQHRYESVVTFYDSQPSIVIVCWLIDTKGMLTSLKAAFEKFQMQDYSKHHFVLLRDFLQMGWEAPFIEGRFKGKSLSDFLNRNPIENTSKPRRALDALLLLDFYRRPNIPNTYRNPKNPKIAD